MEKLLDNSTLVNGIPETGITKKILRAIGAALEPVGAVAELKIVAAHVFQSPPAEKIGRVGVGSGHLKRGARPIERRRLAGGRVEVNGNIRPGTERGAITPQAWLVGGKMGAPDVAPTLAAAVAGEITGHNRHAGPMD